MKRVNFVVKKIAIPVVCMVSSVVTCFAGGPPDLPTGTSICNDCDSIITLENGINSEKIVYERNAKGQVIVEINYSTDSLKEWKKYNKKEYSYEPSGRISIQRNSTWNDSTAVWDSMSRYEYEYDEQGNITFDKEYYLSYNWQLASWSCKYEYEYNNGKMISKIKYQWNQTQQSWSSYVTKTVYQYRGDDLVKVSTYNQNNTAWDQTSPEYIYEYDAQHREIRHFYYYGSIGPNGFEYRSGTKYETEYNAQGKKSIETTYELEKSGGNWTETLTNKYEHKYDAQGNEISGKIYRTQQILIDAFKANNSAQTWVSIYYIPTGLFENDSMSYIYNSDGYICRLNYVYYGYKLPSDYPIPSSLYNVPSNAGLYLSVYWTPADGNPPLVKNPTEYTTQWYCASDATSVIEQNIVNSAITVYPNPTNNLIHINKECNVKVYTIQGRLLHECFGNQVDLSAYAQGMYFLQIDDKTVKIIKK